MLRRQHAGMNSAAIIRISPWLAVSGMLGGLVCIVLSGFGLTRSPRITTHMQPAFNTLIHWRDASRDWLLVADGHADQLIVYNAADGRPLHRLGAERGLHDVDTLAQRDGRLFVVDDHGRLDELKLPQLQMVASSDP